MKVCAFDGGVQSTAALALAAQGKIDFRVLLFANVGDDSENPATLTYIRHIAMPYAAQHGLALHEQSRNRRNGTTETLVGRIFGANRSIVIPARLSNGMPGRRTRTADFKIRVVARWLKQHGTSVENPAKVALGISLDEMHRARTDSGMPDQALEYPLIDLRISRQECHKIISAAVLPTPPKSSCFFCPYHTHAAWLELKRARPDLFAKAVDIERHTSQKRQALGRDAIYLHSSARPLTEAVGDQMSLWKDDPLEVCESGYWMT